MPDPVADRPAPMEVSEADLAEQQTPIQPDADGGPGGDVPPETSDADEADVLDQVRAVSGDDEEYPDPGDRAG